MDPADLERLLDDTGDVFDQSFGPVTAPHLVLRDRSFDRCRFRGIDASGADLTGSSFDECEFTECNLSLAVFTDVVLRGCRFERCKLSGIDWTVARWGRLAAAAPPDFTGSDLRFSSFAGLKLLNAVFADAVAADADFSEAVLTGVDLRRADLTGATFQRADLTNADLRGATGYSISPLSVTLASSRHSWPGVLGLLDAFDISIDQSFDTSPDR